MAWEAYSIRGIPTLCSRGKPQGSAGRKARSSFCCQLIRSQSRGAPTGCIPLLRSVYLLNLEQSRRTIGGTL
jgi:hypothetical protein